MPDFAPETLHARLTASAPRLLRYDTEAYPPEWVSAARRTFKQLLGAMPAPCEPAPRVTAVHARQGPAGGYHEIAFEFTAEPGADVPCWLLVPDRAGQKVPVVICLQGHSAGAHLSLGRPEPDDERAQMTPGAFALQCIERGYAALAIEQRAFGRRADRRPGKRYYGGCHHAAMSALLVGRTLVGERVLDVSRAIDALPLLPQSSPLDLTRIAVMGHSGGGIAAYYAAAYDPRIAAAMPAGCLCTYAASIAALDHCACNYLPGVLGYFELADIAGLIAPRPLIGVVGKDDPIFPAPGANAFADEARAIYAWLGAPDKFTWVAHEGAHVFDPAAAWAAFRTATGW